MVDIREIQIQLNKALVQRCGMELDLSDNGYSLERLYEMAGKEDCVVTLSFREGSETEQEWGESLTCCFLYTERERINLMLSIEKGENNYGKVRARYLLFELPDDKVEKLETEGFDSKDVVEVLVAPQSHPENIYRSDAQRKLNQIEIPYEPQLPQDEMKFEFATLCHFLRDNMLLTPSEHIDFLTLKLLFGAKLADSEKALIFDKDGNIHNNSVSRRYLYFKSKVSELSEEKQKLQFKLEALRTKERMSYLNSQLRKMGSSLDKLKAANEGVYNHITQEVQTFTERRLNFIGRFPIFLDYKGYIHIGLRHIAEWRFSDYYADRHVFQFQEKNVISVLNQIVDEINDDYQAIKAERPNFQYRKYGKNCIYHNGDYYMIHIAADGRVDNFSKVAYKDGDIEQESL